MRETKDKLSQNWGGGSEKVRGAKILEDIRQNETFSSSRSDRGDQDANARGSLSIKLPRTQRFCPFSLSSQRNLPRCYLPASSPTIIISPIPKQPPRILLLIYFTRRDCGHVCVTRSSTRVSPSLYAFVRARSTMDARGRGWSGRPRERVALFAYGSTL